MDVIWTPWRMQYVAQAKPQGCILCTKWREETDRENFVLYRGPTCYVLLNIYPYNPAHLMIAPYEHVATLAAGSEAARHELIDLASQTTTLLTEALSPHGFNLGLNLGRVAGAGIDDHVHLHVVPRWNGDSNFMPVLASTKVLPEALEATYDTLRPLFDRLVDRSHG